jgi:hypothetical protein
LERSHRACFSAMSGDWYNSSCIDGGELMDRHAFLLSEPAALRSARHQEQKDS